MRPANMGVCQAGEVDQLTTLILLETRRVDLVDREGVAVAAVPLLRAINILPILPETIDFSPPWLAKRNQRMTDRLIEGSQRFGAIRSNRPGSQTIAL